MISEANQGESDRCVCVQEGGRGSTALSYILVMMHRERDRSVMLRDGWVGWRMIFSH